MIVTIIKNKADTWFLMLEQRGVHYRVVRPTGEVIPMEEEQLDMDSEDDVDINDPKVTRAQQDTLRRWEHEKKLKEIRQTGQKHEDEDDSNHEIKHHEVISHQEIESRLSHWLFSSKERTVGEIGNYGGKIWFSFLLPDGTKIGVHSDTRGPAIANFMTLLIDAGGIENIEIDDHRSAGLGHSPVIFKIKGKPSHWQQQGFHATLVDLPKKDSA